MPRPAQALPKRPVAREKIDLAKKVIQDNPLVKACEFQKEYNLHRDTASCALRIAREELRQNDASLADKAQAIRLRQQHEALVVLNRQIARLDELPDILAALRAETFDIQGGKVVGIKPHISGYNKGGEAIYVMPAKIVGDYLAAEASIIEQERLVTGIAAAEKVNAAAAGKTDITFQLPATVDDLRTIKPL